jgi:hypothetical protein
MIPSVTYGRHNPFGELSLYQARSVTAPFLPVLLRSLESTDRRLRRTRSDHNPCDRGIDLITYSCLP